MATFEPSVPSIGQCPVCSERISDPKQLSCSHTFCKKCLSNILSCSSQSTSLACPFSDCRKTTAVKDGDLVNLNTNSALRNLIEEVRKTQELCTMCDTHTKYTHFCHECGKNMCDQCLENHNKWPPHYRHRVQNVDDIKEGRVVLALFCQEHKGDLCTDVCLTCMKFICTRCRKIDHENKGHTVQDLENYKSSVKNQIESQQARGEIKATSIKNHEKYVNVQKRRVDDHVNDIRADIDLIHTESIKKIKERWAALGTQLQTQRVRLCKSLDDMIVADKLLVMRIESASVLAIDSLKAPLEVDTINIRGSLSEGLEKILKEKDPIEQLATNVGNRAENLIFQQNNERDQLGIGEIRFKTCKLECNVPIYGMIDMAATPDGRMAIGYTSGEINVFSAEGQLQEKVAIGVSICKVAFLSDGRYVVRDASNTTALYTSEQKRLEVAFETLGQDDGSSDLTVDSEDMIYISCRKAKNIQMFSPEGGKATMEIPCIGYEPIQITSHDDLLIVTGKKKIRMVNKYGQVKHRLQQLGCQPFAAVTQNNTVLVAWVKDIFRTMSIDEYTKELSLIRNVITDHRIEKPARCYCLNVFSSGDIAFCTPEILYIFN